MATLGCRWTGTPLQSDFPAEAFKPLQFSFRGTPLKGCKEEGSKIRSSCAELFVRLPTEKSRNAKSSCATLLQNSYNVVSRCLFDTTFPR